jgi:hypothetical protein
MAAQCIFLFASVAQPVILLVISQNIVEVRKQKVLNILGVFL